MTSAAPYRLSETFLTPRYMLRRCGPDDAEAIFASYSADPEVTRFLGWTPHRDAAETRAFLACVTSEWDEAAGFPAVVVARAAPCKILGMFHPRVMGSRISYGYVLARRAWGRGCASEILSALVQDALSHPAIFRTEAFCDTRNHASARVIEKAGMVHEGVLRRYFIHPNIATEPTDCLLYARTR